MYVKTTDNLNLYYEIHGKTGSKKILVFLNGLAQSTQAWMLMVPAFEQEFAIILLDFIFQGRSDKEGEVRDFDRHAEDVRRLLDSLKADRVSLVGISYGSLVAQHFAANYPAMLERLLLLSTFAQKTPYYDALEFSWQRALDAGGYPLMLEVMLPIVLGEGYFENPLIPIEALKKARLEINNDPWALKKLMAAIQLRGDYREKLKNIKTPTLVIHGERDALFPVHMGREAADLIPGSRFEVIPGAGHTLNLEAIPQAVALMNNFLRAS